jgi:lysozyme family protein
MAASSYDAALARLLVHEGGYTNDAADPGGPTNFGITIIDYRMYVKPGATAADVRAMKIEEAKAIYRSKYWDAQRCDDLPAGVDDCLFDYGVNSGIGRSKKVLQRCLGLTADGVLGDSTMNAVRASDAKKLIDAICDERLRFLKGLRTWPVFGKGWGRRVAEVRAFCLQLAAKAPAVMPDLAPQVQSAGKGVVPVAKSARKGSAGAVVAAGAAAAQQAHQAGADPALIAGIVIVALITLILAWRVFDWRQQSQQERPA